MIPSEPIRVRLRTFAELIGNCGKVEEIKIFNSLMSVLDRSGHQMNLCNLDKKIWFSELFRFRNFKNGIIELHYLLNFLI